MPCLIMANDGGLAIPPGALQAPLTHLSWDESGTFVLEMAAVLLCGVEPGHTADRAWNGEWRISKNRNLPPSEPTPGLADSPIGCNRVWPARRWPAIVPPPAGLAQQRPAPVPLPAYARFVPLARRDQHPPAGYPYQAAPQTTGTRAPPRRSHRSQPADTPFGEPNFHAGTQKGGGHDRAPPTVDAAFTPCSSRFSQVPTGSARTSRHPMRSGNIL